MSLAWVAVTPVNLHRCKCFRSKRGPGDSTYALYFDDESEAPLFEVLDMDAPRVRLPLVELEGWLPRAATEAAGKNETVEHPSLVLVS
jgi:hypothetical protein